MEKNQVYETLNKAYFSAECHEKKAMKHLPSMLKSAKVFVDIGASLGQYTRLATENIQEGHIYAIEADPIRFEELERNCRKWSRLSGNKVTALNAAACDTDGKAEFFTTNSNVSGGLFRHDLPSCETKVAWDKIEVDCITLDALFEDKIPDFIKIDVEGAELSVLRGAVDIIRSGKPKFLIEVHYWGHTQDGEATDDVFEFMKSFGYYPLSYYGNVLFVNSGALLFRAKLSLPLLRSFYRFKSFVKTRLLRNAKQDA